ncbi:phage tail protein [Roseateles sp. DAIF2]|uniref:phage tail protein n=1 Tax=Roseateles sp. DAIF2 TaxID=2714952 RepID=UPI00201E5830|nr:tail fiber protein [Roseateles sp. DAIF2]
MMNQPLPSSLVRPLQSLALGLGLMIAAAPAQACSAEPLLGSICLVPYNFCPRGFADASGQILSIAQNTALFSLLGTTYGGDGRVTFALPDLRGRVPLGSGTGPGLGPIDLGQVGGQETAQLTVAQMPAHSHGAQLRGSSAAGNTDSPAGAVSAKLARSNVYSSAGPDTNMSASAITVGSAGNGQPFSIRDPYLGLRYCIAIEGIFPSRN